MSAPALPAGLVLAPLGSVAEPGAGIVQVEHNGVRVSLVIARAGGEVRAFLNICPHAGYPLQRADGTVVVQEGRYLACGAHGASFALSDGGCAGGPCNGDPLTPVAVTVRDGFVCTV